MSDFLVVTCDHGGNRIPAPYRNLFRGWQARLDTHRGYDFGSLVVAKHLAAAMGAPLVTATVSRLLVDVNRSIGHPHLWSGATRRARADVQQQILRRYYQPYRNRVEEIVARAVAGGHRVVHLSSHSFTPKLDGQLRNADVGLLYDPARPGEVALAARWKTALGACAPQLTVRRNYPYAGRNDGLTSHLRKRFPPSAYVGIEIEINQKHVLTGGGQWKRLRDVLIESLQVAREPARGDCPVIGASHQIISKGATHADPHRV